MYTKIALVLLGITVSVGGALAVVLVQTSSVKRPLGPQVASLSSETSMKPRIERSVAAPAAAPTAVARDYAPLTTARPVMRPFLAPLSERAVARLVVEQPATSSVEVAPQQEVDVARAPAPALPAFGASASEPSRSAFDSFLNSLQQPEAQQPPRQLGLIEQPRTSRDALAETWTIGVYR